MAVLAWQVTTTSVSCDCMLILVDDTRKSLASKVINSEGNEYTDSEHNKSCNSEQKRTLEQKKIDLKNKMSNHSVTAIYRRKRTNKRELS